LISQHNHRMVGVGNDLWGSPSPTPYRSRVTQSRLHRTLSRRVLNISREGDSTATLGSLGQCSITLRGKKFFLMFRRNFLCFGLCPLPLVLSLGTTGEMLQSPHHPLGPLLDSLQQLLIFLEVGSPEVDTGLQMRPHQGGVEGKENLPRPAGHTLLNAPQGPIGFLGSQGTLLAHGQILIIPSFYKMHQRKDEEETGHAWRNTLVPPPPCSLRALPACSQMVGGGGIDHGDPHPSCSGELSPVEDTEQMRKPISGPALRFL